MKKFLPVFFATVFAVSLFISAPKVYAQPAPTLAPVQLTNPAAVPTGGLWVVDPEVTFIGKNAARSGQMLDWTLKNYNWVCVNQIGTGHCDNSKNPLAAFWGLIVLYIVVPMLFVVILATAIVIIITRGRSLTIMRFIPRFVAVILLIVFSYSIVQFLYQFTDLIQGFFLRSQDLATAGPCPPNCISQKDLLFVGWRYEQFIGLRLLGDYNAESAFISLLLTKLTALTYFVMVGILLMRRIILWFFIIISPVFPLLLLYYPVRNTGKIWIGEFFRWLLYAPLFAIFLKGLVYLWQHQIPLNFTNPAIGSAAGIIYPTAVNILLGGPKQFVTPTNSVNLTETFALYVVALIMLWCVILLPWILLQIFLDYASNLSPSDTAVMRTLVNVGGNKGFPPAGGGGSTPPGSGGAAISLPFTKRFNIPTNLGPTGSAKEIKINAERVETRFAQPAFIPAAQVNAQVLTATNLTLPTMRDIAKYETALMSNNATQRQEVTQVKETLERIANPANVESSTDRDRYVEIREKLVQESQQGNVLATSILNAANQSAQMSTTQIKNILQQIANPTATNSVVDRERMSSLHEMLQHESKENNSELASTLLSVNEKTTATEIEKIRESLSQAQQQSNSVASSVLSSMSDTQRSSRRVTETKKVIQQIANPASVTNTVEREKFSKLHDALKKESQENNNQLATSILSVSDTTSLTELEKIHDQIMNSKDSTVASTVLSTINNAAQQTQSSTRVKTVLQQVANPNAVTNIADREKLTKLHESLAAASKDGNQLAASILGVSDKTPVADIAKLQERIMQSKGQPLANQLADMTQKAANTSIPSLNRVQTVTSQDYQAVKEMWRDNYHKLEVPQGMAGSREEWIKDDIGKIDSITKLLSSSNPEDVTQGLEQVSNILPFLMVGGFSQTEIIEYLKAKQEAAKEVTLELVTEEEEKVTVGVKHEVAQQTMAATMEESSLSSSRAETIGEMPEVTLTPTFQPQISNEIMTMVNVKLPRMQDIARFETMSLSQDKSKFAEVQKMHEVLDHISNPSKISDTVERERYERLRDKLVEESSKGNSTANIFLSAASSIGKTEFPAAAPVQVKTILQQIANPGLASAIDKDRLTKLHDELSKAGEQGNDLAKEVLDIKDTTALEDIEKLSNKLRESKEKGEPLAGAVLSNIAGSGIPTANLTQKVEPEDYDEVKEMWEENYRTLPVPTGYSNDIKGRIDWIKADANEMQQAVDLLSSQDTEKRNEGVKKLSGLLPFLLLGGFSFDEMVSYLKVKISAGETVRKALEEEESKMVSVPNTSPQEEHKEMAAQIEPEKKEENQNN